MKSTEAINVLEFDKVLSSVAKYAHCPATREAIMDIRPMADLLPIAERHGLIDETRRLSDRGTPLGLLQFDDIRPLIDRLRPEGSVLEPAELLSILTVLTAIGRVFEDAIPDEHTPRLSSMAESLPGFPELKRTIGRTVGPEGEVLDSASSTLRELRMQIRALQKKITNRLESIVRDAEYTPFIQDDFITTRSGRWVIPVRMDAKGQVRGVVHDVSRTGETAFVEPIEIIGLSNELENLVAEEKAEVIRILRAISRSLRQVLPDLDEQFHRLVHIDLIASIANLAQKLRMTTPTVGESCGLRLSGARHPLLMLLMDKVIPLDLDLGTKSGAMVITGPNAGGKTIAIKTAGLLLVMALSGMPVPGGDGCTFPIVQNVLADIGDEQSIEASLSTFAGHMGNLGRIIAGAGPNSLILIDELGTGTDPAEGAALGCAILRELIRKGSMVLATTHLVDIVGFVEREPAMQNACMEFDPNLLIPLYKLKPGEPGQSHALEAALRYGMPRHIIDEARQLMGPIRAEFNSLITEMKEKRHAYEEELVRAAALRAGAERDRATLTERLGRIEQERKLALKNALEEARDLITKASRDARKFLDEVKAEKTKAPLKSLDTARTKIEKKLEKLSPSAENIIETLAEGDMVFVKTLGEDALVLKVNRAQNRVTIQAGNKELELPISYLAPAKGQKPSGEVTVASHTEQIAPREIKLIGKRVDEALELIEGFLNQAAMAGIEEVRIIHGVGTGALKRAVHEFLKGHPMIESYRLGEQDEGGAGVTVGKLR